MPKKTAFDKKVEQYGFSPADPAPGTVEYEITSLEEPTGREARYPNSGKKGFGRHLPDGIDGYETDRFGRPIPSMDKERILHIRRHRYCPAFPYCEDPPFRDFFACMKHWYMIPPAIRTKVWRKSRWEVDMELLKPAVKEAVYWLHYALGPSITPERVADRVLERMALSKSDSILVLGHILWEKVVESCEDGNAVSHAVEADGVFKQVWHWRLETVWR